MLNSKFVAFFLDEVTEWQKKLSTADIVIHAWSEVQRVWTNLESIFIGSEDIRRQLPEQSKLFDKVDREFRVGTLSINCGNSAEIPSFLHILTGQFFTLQQMITEMNQIPNVVKATNRPHLQEKLEAFQLDLTTCEKALTEYLETKKLAYPRFYFISDALLLEILSNSNQPEKVCK